MSNLGFRLSIGCGLLLCLAGLGTALAAEPAPAQAPRVPATPPGFTLPAGLGPLSSDDYTDTTQKALPDAKVAYSAVWSRYLTHEKTWEQMSPAEQQEFENLRKAVAEALAAGVKAAGGRFEMRADSEQDSANMLRGDWRVTHESNPLVTLWWVTCSTARPLTQDKPFINVYIAHSELR